MGWAAKVCFNEQAWENTNVSDLFSHLPDGLALREQLQGKTLEKTCAGRAEDKRSIGAGFTPAQVGKMGR